MKVVMISKALIVGAYQSKLVEIARQPGVELICIVPPAWRQDGRLMPLERAYSGSYELIVEPIRWNGNFHLFYFPGLARQLRRLQPDIVHIDEEPYNLATFLATRQARRQGARPLFFSWQNLLRRYPPPFCWLERDVLRNACYAIAGSEDAGRVLRSKGFRGPLAVIPQFGVDAERFSPDPAGEATGRPFTIGYLGRLVREKGLSLLLEALAGLEGDWRLELYGHGPLKPVLADRAAGYGLTDRVRLADPVGSTEVPNVLRSLDALVLPSLTQRNWKEQFGRILIEAMACGVPVVGSDSGEIPNVIGEAGLCFPEGDAAALRKRLRELFDSAELRRELASRGRARVLEQFTHERIARSTCEVYRALMPTAPVGAPAS